MSDVKIQGIRFKESKEGQLQFEIFPQELMSFLSIFKAQGKRSLSGRISPIKNQTESVTHLAFASVEENKTNG